MKKLLYSIILISSIGYTQTRSIEVEVRDTIRLKALEFEYLIKVQESYNLVEENYGENYDPQISKEKNAMKLFQIKEFLANKNYEFKSINEDQYSINNSIYFGNNGYKVVLKSESELKTLVKELRKLDFVNGSLGDIKYEDDENQEEKLLAKLISKARNKANVIAGLSGLKIVRILEFKEIKEIDNFSFNIMDLYLTAQQQGGWNIFDNRIFGEKSKAIVVKFEAD